MARLKDQYYTMPLKLVEVMRGEQLDQMEIRKAIHQNIRLILKSMALSYRFDPTFGSLMNKYHAATPPQKKSTRVWREELRENIQKNLKDMLQRYETRLNITDVAIDMREPNFSENKPVVKVKVEVFGQLTLGRKEQFYYPDSEISEDAQEVLPLVIPIGRK